MTIEGPASAATCTCASANQRSARAFRRAFARDRGQDLSGGSVYQARADGAHCLGFAPLNAADAESPRPETYTTHALGLVVAAKLGNGAHNDCINPKDSCKLLCSRRISTVAIGKVLFRQDLVQRLALDDPVLATLQQFFYQH